MTSETLEKIANALNTTERELFDFTEYDPDKFLIDNINDKIRKYKIHELKFILSFLENYDNLKNNS